MSEINFLKRIVNKGKHDYTPGHKGVGFKNEGYTVIFNIPESAWFDPTSNGPIQSDGKDWNKIAGVSFINPFNPSTWPKNVNSALIAWRPAIEYGWFEVCAYTNDHKGKWTTSEPILIEGGKGGAATVDVGRRDVKYTLQGKTFTHKNSLKRSRLTIAVGPWFGGNRTAPNRHYIFTDFKMK